MTDSFSRRALLTLGLAGVAVLTGCIPEAHNRTTTEETPAMTPDAQATTGPDARVLLVFFSRAGENYYYGGRRTLDVGNTEVLAGMIADRIDCDTYEIEAAKPYPEAYDATVARNSREQDSDARTAIADQLPDVSGYDVVLIGSPVWNSRAPMIMSTFIDRVDLAGKVVLPFVTYAVSGMSGVDTDYREALPRAEVRDGLAVQGEAVSDAGSDLDEWLRSNDLV